MSNERPTTKDLRKLLQHQSLPLRDERLSYLRPSAVPGTEILSAYDSFAPWRVFHERYAVCACRTAAAGWRYRGDSYFLQDGSSMLLEPGELHANTKVHKYSDFKVLFIEPKIVIDAARELGVAGAPHYRIAQANAPGLLTAVYDFCTAAEEGAIPLELQSRFAVCLRQLFGLTEKPPPDPVVRQRGKHRAVQLAKDYLRQCFQQPIALDDLVAAAGLSRFHLLRTFAREVGVPPHAYQIHLRVERAAALLRAGMPPSAVADLVGFADQSHCTRHFRRVMRVTPARYAQAAGRPRVATRFVQS